MSAVDWEAKPEPWRSMGREFAAQAARIMKGYVPPPSVDREKTFPGYRLADIRRTRGMTQAQLADRCGYDRSLILYIENGHTKNPRPATKRDIAGALGVAVTDIWPAA